MEPEAPFQEGDTPSALRVSHASAGQRLDQCLAAAFPARSRVFFQRLLKGGNVRLNGQPCRPSSKVETNDLITLEWPDLTPPAIQAEAVAFGVVFEDDDVLVIDKPPNLVVHPARGHTTGTLVHGLLFHDSDHFGGLVDEEMRPGIVHRLDKDTSGVMVVAKNEDARAALKHAFKQRSVEKTYLALVVGEFGVAAGEMRNRIGRNPRTRQKMAVVREGGKPAVSKYRVLAAAEGMSLVQVRLRRMKPMKSWGLPESMVPEFPAPIQLPARGRGPGPRETAVSGACVVWVPEESGSLLARSDPGWCGRIGTRSAPGSPGVCVTWAGRRSQAAFAVPSAAPVCAW